MSTQIDDHILRILVADDEAGIRTGMRRALEGLSVGDEAFGGKFTVEVLEAADGLETQARLAEQPAAAA